MKKEKIAILGISHFGTSLALFLNKRGYNVFLSDIKKKSTLKKYTDELEKADIAFETGRNTKKLLRADIIVRSPGVWLIHPLLLEAKVRKIPVINGLDLLKRYLPKKTKIVAVTGTNGKTTTVNTITNILKTAGYKCAVSGHRNTPLPYLIESKIKYDFILLEMGAAELDDFKGMDFFACILLNLHKDHLDRFKKMSLYASAKMNIFNRCRSKALCIINKDNKYIRSFLNSVSGKLIPFSTKVSEGSHYYIKKNIIFHKRSPIIEIPNKIHINKECLVACISFCHKIGINKKDIKRCLSFSSPIEHRFEEVRRTKGITFINDAKSTNFESLRFALKKIKGKKILIIEGRDRNNIFISVIKKLQKMKDIRKILISGDIAKDFTKKHPYFIKNDLQLPVDIIIGTMKRTVKSSFSFSKKGDTVIFSPGFPFSLGSYKSAEERGNQFKEAVMLL